MCIRDRYGKGEWDVIRCLSHLGEMLLDSAERTPANPKEYVALSDGEEKNMIVRIDKAAMCLGADDDLEPYGTPWHGFKTAEELLPKK